MTATATDTGVRHLTSLADLSHAEFAELIDLAGELKRGTTTSNLLAGHTVACIFEKPSTRTRVSFAAAIARLGGTPVVLSASELQLGRGESIADTARSLSGYCDAIVIRTFAQSTVEELASAATVPVVNALSDEHHPCQALADVLTVVETFGHASGVRLTFVGDGGGNVARSLLQAGALTGMHVTIACPAAFAPSVAVVGEARALARETDAELDVHADPVHAVTGADVVYTDVWTSMGSEHEADRRESLLAPYQVTPTLMAAAAEDAIFMHCLPAHRDEEVAADVIDGPQSRVWQQSANRLPTEEALLLWLLGRGDR